MQTKFSKLIIGIHAALLLANIASAHPGHAPTDLAAQVSQPLAGPDHLIAFVALTSVLLAALGVALKARHTRLKTRRVDRF
ncbi:MAG TPA: HupE/UreJ family protein [Methylomirabilota bacterium]|nr:HupE/UreJ family protein [Methylomirabilota bacterium]